MLLDIFKKNIRLCDWCGCGICMGRLEKEIIKRTDDTKDGFFLYELNTEDKNQILKKVSDELKSLRKSNFYGLRSFLVTGGPDFFFSPEGNFIRSVIMLLDRNFNRKELHKLLTNSLARAYLIRMENHYNRVNAHYRS